MKFHASRLFQILCHMVIIIFFPQPAGCLTPSRSTTFHWLKICILPWHTGREGERKKHSGLGKAPSSKACTLDQVRAIFSNCLPLMPSGVNYTVILPIPSELRQEHWLKDYLASSRMHCTTP